MKRRSRRAALNVRARRVASARQRRNGSVDAGGGLVNADPERLVRRPAAPIGADAGVS